jgi:aspartyl-tRNA(Asn)/glutamyl-tRNA(Gln) amidotransferase subunit A
MLTRRTLKDLAEALGTSATTSRQLVEECLARIEDPAGEGDRTFIRVYADQARAGADAMDALRRANRAPGPYAGIPVSIKDLFDVAGETTKAGSRVLEDAAPAQQTAPAIARLLAAGFVPIGRTNMTEFAFSGVGINPHYGTPRSPWERPAGDTEAGRIPGGSSSGAAVSVADGFAACAIGTDTGGSCRIPAALCGIAGYKPTARRIPLQGAYPLAPSLDSIGPLARSAACCATLDGILSGAPDRILPRAQVSGLRLLLPTNVAFANIDDSVEDALDRAVLRLDAAGALIDRRALAAFDQITEAHAKGGFAATEAYTWHRPLLATGAQRYDPRVASRIAPGGDMSGADYFLLTQARARIIRQFAADMAPYDALILPTVPIAPPLISAFATDESYRRLNFLLLRNPSAINFLDGCAISLPCHAPNHPPAGLMLAAPAMRDGVLLAIACAIEAVLP